MVVGLGILLGVVVGVLLLVLALLWLKRSRHFKRESDGAKIKSDGDGDDPFIHNYQSPYNAEPDYASWINQNRPLPLQPENNKPGGVRDIQIVHDPCIHTGTVPRRADHIYESPQFQRRISAPPRN